MHSSRDFAWLYDRQDQVSFRHPDPVNLADEHPVEALVAVSRCLPPVQRGDSESSASSRSRTASSTGVGRSSRRLGASTL
jgi:hypothetical protein